MKSTAITETSIDKLVFDDKNFNRGTQFGEHLMDKSIRELGLGRSILLDKNNRIIAGNKTTEKAGELGFDKVVVVETDGNTLVAVKRTDVDLDSQKGRELALADNATSKANLEWDSETLAEVMDEFGQFAPNDWGIKVDAFDISPDDFGDDFSLKSGDKSPYQQMTFTLSDTQAERVKSVLASIGQMYTEELKCVDGNTNKNGNALYKAISIWEEQGRLK